MNSKDSINITGGSYSSEFQRLSEKLLYFQRKHYRQAPSQEIDTFPSMWGLGIANLSSDQVRVHRKGHYIERQGLWAAFIPPFNMIDWRLAPGPLNFRSYLSIAKVPPYITKKAIAFPWNEDWKPQSTEEIFEIIHQVKDPLFINKEETLCSAALKTKEIIDQTFNDSDVGLSFVAESLSISHSFMSRAFKKAYGLTPVAYRNSLRVIEATKLMLFHGHNVTLAGHEVGFLDNARFNKQFKRQMNAVPSKYCIEKKLQKLEA